MRKSLLLRYVLLLKGKVARCINIFSFLLFLCSRCEVRSKTNMDQGMGKVIPNNSLGRLNLYFECLSWNGDIRAYSPLIFSFLFFENLVSTCIHVGI